MASVSAIVVCYLPEIENLERLLKAVSEQVDTVVLVNNGPSDVKIDDLVARYGAIYKQQQVNVGVAQGFNVGIEEALNSDASYIITFDQDSLPSPSMITQLKAVAEQKKAQGYRVGALGPQLADVKGNKHPSFVVREGVVLEAVTGGSSVIEVDLLISSGLLMPANVLRDIGLMESELFIDGVDNEWCLRAKAAGYTLYGVDSARMEHDLGDAFALFRGKEISVHQPFRYYYMIRNMLWLARQNWLSKEWKKEEVWRAFVTYVVYSFFVGQRFRNWKMMTLGVFHAIIGRTGRLGGE